MIQSETKVIYNILIVADTTDDSTIEVANLVVDGFIEEQIFKVYTDCEYCLNEAETIDEGIKIDYIVSIGENNTLMRAIRHTGKYNEIPIISISNGLEPLMISYSYSDIESVLTKFIEEIKKNSVRISSTLTYSVIAYEQDKLIAKFSSELELHRDMASSVLKLNIYIRKQTEDYLFLASLWGDGLIISTPMGSMGRSMSHHGPILHKAMECIIISPVCPLSLNYRPIILPAETDIIIEVVESSRAPAMIYVDGQQINPLLPGLKLKICKSQHATKFVKGLAEKTSLELWINNLREVIGWGEHYHTKIIEPQLKQRAKSCEQTQIL